MAETTALEQASDLRWGTFGCGAIERYEKRGVALPPIVWKRVGDLDTDHLEAILAHTQLGDGRYGPDTEFIQIAVKVVLEDRRKKNKKPGFGMHDPPYSLSGDPGDC